VSEGVDLFARIQQKGGVTSKQLAGVGLGEFNVPAFFKDLGKQLHVSAAVAEKMAKRPGGVDPQLLSNSITDAINRMQHGPAGTGAGRAAGELSGQWNKFKTLPEEFFNKLAKDPSVKEMQRSFGEILKQLDPEGPTGKKILEHLKKAFGQITKWIAETITTENIDKFVAALTKVPGYLSQAIDLSEIFIGVWVTSKILGTFTGLSGSAAGFAQGLAGAATQAGVLAGQVALVLAGWTAIDMIADKYTKKARAEGLEHDLGPQYKEGTGRSIYAAVEDARGPRGEGRGSAKTVINHVNVGGVHVDAANDPTHTGQKAAVAIGDGMQKALGRARDEAGAM
jgi:hypothetical protein